MPSESQTNPKRTFAPRRLPWLVAMAMLVVYGLTLNHWVTLANLLPVGKVSGYLWQPELFGPLQFLVTYPFRWLPTAAIPLALNLFSALCAATTLGLLARSVALLPHDRTEAERLRERSDFGFLTTGSAWFPPVLAVVLLGLEFGFWQNATSFTGESLNLLIFATVIWLLLEFRLDERLGRLYLAALIYGAGMTENWAHVGFLPVFVIAIFWLRGLEFFNLRFLTRMTLCALAGMTFFLVLPVVGKISGTYPMSFGALLKPALREDWQVIKTIANSDVRYYLILMSVTTLLPILVMAIRWSASFGDASRIGKKMVTYLFYGINAVLFGVCVWVMFDSPFSPHEMSFNFPFYILNGTPALTLYYLSALGVGYFSGYFVLVFGKKAVATRRNPRPTKALPGKWNALTPLIYAGVYVAAGLAVGALIYKNLPLISSVNDDTLLKYAQLTEQNLPAGGGVLLSDAEGISSSPQTRALILQMALARSGRDRQFLVVDTQSLNWAPYHRFLHKRFPQKWPQVVKDQEMGGISPLGILSTLNQVARSNTICYLNPSYGYYFELFYLEPHGLTYQMKLLPEASLMAPPLATNLIADNQAFWNHFADTEMRRLQKAPQPRDPNAKPKNFAEWLLRHLHGESEFNPNVELVNNFYSRSLDYWGVELQRAGQLSAAAQCFVNAQIINPDNIAAAINLEFNHSLQTGANPVIDPRRVTPDQFGKYRDWNAVMNANGPFDEPSFIFANSLVLAQGGLMRQAIAPFARVRQLAPDNLPARLWLAQLYLYNRLPDRALEALHDPLTQQLRFSLTESNSAELNLLASAGYFQKNELARGVELLDQEIARHPNDDMLQTIAARAFFMGGLYTNALRVIEHRLAQTPDDPQWLFGEGFANLQLGRYGQAITAMTRVMEVSTNNPTARFNRALAYLKNDQLDRARADYAELQNTYTNSIQIAYGLAEVAWRQHNTNEAVRNYQLYLANAPTNSAEAKIVRERLMHLRGH
jgi:tetratricopeptide (TPR) repeat protein